MNLIAYTIAFRPDYRAAQLHHKIANALQRVENGLTRRLMIFVPPRHGKSMLTSEHFAPWYLGRNPHRSIVCATYAQDLADDFGRKVRNQMIDPLYREIFPNCGVSPDSASIQRIATEQNGNYYAVGIGGALTGRGAHVLLIDDPHKDRQEAESEQMRKRAKDWFQAVAYTRLMEGGAIVLMMTRWHTDDLAGWLLNEHSDESWEVLSIPAIPPPWPERYPEAELDRIRLMVGPREWSALYMQEPIPGAGGEFKRDWLRWYEGSPTSVGGGQNIYILVDPAGEKRPDNDYTSIWCVGLGADENYYLLDAVRDRLNLAERGRKVMELHRKWNRVGRVHGVRYERYGMMGDVQFILDLQNRENYRFEITEVGGKLKKEDRIRRLIGMFELKKVYLPRDLHYTDTHGVPRDMIHEFIETEYAAFPASRHDDMLDSLSRIVEPELPLIWPQKVLTERKDRYARHGDRRGTVWST